MIRFFCAGIPKSMSVGSAFRFKKAGVERHIQGRRNTDWCTLVGQIGRQHAPAALLDGPLAFTALFYLPRPATASRKVVFPTKRPDIDNLVHKLTDQFNGVFWQDDSQVIDFIVRKRFAQVRPGVEIVVEPVNSAPG
jgi:Holliday junction resolvase RusA-like endonuclease